MRLVLFVISNVGCPLFGNPTFILMISFKRVDLPKDVILYAVFFYVRYGVSYRNLEEIMERRGVKVDHANITLKPLLQYIYLS